MNSWFLLRRLRGPAFIILFGITALLDQWGILRFSRSWPMYLILAGVFGLLERSLLSGAPPVPPYPNAYPNAYQGTYPGNAGAAPAHTDPATPAVLDAPRDPDGRS